MTVEKVAYCAFHASRLQFVLDAMGMTWTDLCKLADDADKGQSDKPSGGE